MNIEAAVRHLRAGEVVAIPAEGVYGYSVDALNPQALERLVTYKGRDDSKGLIVLIGGLAQLADLCPPLSAAVLKKLRQLWAAGQPPTTVILPALSHLPALLTGGKGTVAVRLPQPKDMLALLKKFGGPLVSTSANKSGAPAIYTMADLPPDFNTLPCDRVLRGGVSRIYDIARGQWLR